MRLRRHVITLFCLVASCLLQADELRPANVQVVAPSPTGPDLERLQGTWEGVREEGEKAVDKVTITITGSSFHFHRDTNFWFETTISLPAGTHPKQLHATIRKSATSQADSIGKTVGAIYRIEDDTLTLVDYSITDEPPSDFANAMNRYVLKKVRPPKKSTP